MDMIVSEKNYSGLVINYHGRVFVCERRLDELQLWCEIVEVIFLEERNSSIAWISVVLF